MEASRFVFKVPGRSLILIGMLCAGLFAHSVFLLNELFFINDDAVGQLLSNWFQWAVLGAWGLSVACLILTIRYRNRSIGLFLIPIILVLIGMAQLVRSAEPFQPDTTASLWRVIHGVSLSVGTMFICIGFAFGVMYLVQSNRLKRKKTSGGRVIRLPALDFLQWMNTLSLNLSTAGLAIGLLSGIVLNLSRSGEIIWFSGDIVFTFALFAISLMGTLIELFSSRQLGGRRSAYLAIANFVFLVIILGLVLVSSHGRNNSTSDSTKSALSRSEVLI